METRLAWRLAALMLAAILLAAGAVTWRAVATARSLDDAGLQVEAHTLARYLVRAPDGQPMLNLPPDLRGALRLSDDRSLIVVVDAAGHVLLNIGPGSPAGLAAYLPPQPGVFYAPGVGTNPKALVGAVVQAGPWRLAVAQTRERSEALADSMRAALLASGLTVLAPIGLATVLIGLLTVRFGLRPLRDVSAAAAALGPTQFGARLPEARLPGEVRPLVKAMNEALGRLEAALDGQRRFVGEAAHALRTPLAVLTARLDGMQGLPEIAALRQDAGRMARLVDQMLKMARLESMPLDVTRPVSLRQVAVEAISLLAPIAVQRRIALVLTETAALPPMPGHHTALVTALTNLIENALAQAPPDSTVEIVLAPPGTVRVLDRGPGVADEERERIFGRFERGRTAPSAGAGLGLAIVAEVAAAHGGSVQVAAREGGGAVFTLHLSGAAAQADPVTTSQAIPVRPGSSRAGVTS